MIGTDRYLSGCEKYFELFYGSDGKLSAVIPKNDEINREKENCGYFVIITSAEMTAKEALALYKSRDASEKIFRSDKSYLGGGNILQSTVP